MATSLAPVVLIAGVWKDLYADTGIAVGTKITIENRGARDAVLTEANAQPPLNIESIGYSRLLSVNSIRNGVSQRDSPTTPIGVWAYSSAGTTLQVEVAP